MSKRYKKTMGVFWWTKKGSHIKFILRELTSLCVAFFSIEFLFLIRSVSEGEEAYNAYIAQLGNPFPTVLNILALGGLLFHSITWFDLAPKAMVIKLGKKQIPGIFIAGANYAGWVVVSAIVVYLFFWMK